MWRKAAIQYMLLDDLCSLPAGANDDASTSLRLRKARRRARLVVAIDWLALLVLFLLRSRAEPWLELGPTEESIFTIGVLVVAVHSGFRLAQLDKLRRVTRLIEELNLRAPDS